MKRVLAVIVALVAISPAAPASETFTTIATDPAGDAQLGTYDITALNLRRVGDELEIQIDLPDFNTAAAVASTLWVDWRFVIGERVYVVSATPGRAQYWMADESLEYISGQPYFELAELTVRGDNYMYETLLKLEGEFSDAEGHVKMFVPLDAIAARKGTALKPAQGFGEFQLWTYATEFNLYDSARVKKTYRIP